MKKYLTPIVLCLGSLSAALVNSCKKDSASNGSTLTEEFQMVYTLNEKGWVMQDNTRDTVNFATAGWSQGVGGTDKSGTKYGFPAFSYKSSETEYAYSFYTGVDTSYSMSSWLISPILAVKNGDRFSFYTRGDDDRSGVMADRMQVLMSHSTSADVGTTLNSVGDFTTTLFDINGEQKAGGYPETWTKYEYTFSGLIEKTNLRIAFRHYTDHSRKAGGVALDLFQFQSR
jgi:hypothetical protein